MRRLRPTTWVLAGLVLAGCGADPVPDQLAAPAASVASASPSTNTSPGAGTPVTEPARTETSASPATSPVVEGDPTAAEVQEVERFIRDYYDAINRAQYEGDLAGLEAFSLPECNCRALVTAIAEAAGLGRIEGAAWSLRTVQVKNLTETTASVTTTVEIPDGRVAGTDGRTVMAIRNQGNTTFMQALLREGKGWQIGQVVEE